MRTRRNGEELTVLGLVEDFYEVADASNDEAEKREFAKDLRYLAANQRTKGFTEGVDFGAQVENRVAVQAIVSSLLTVLGKDPGDGIIDLGAAGRWYPGADGGLATKEGADR